MREILERVEKGGKAVDPVEAARSSLRHRLPKRFYTDVAVAAAGKRFEIRLDGKPVKTPARRTLRLPTLAAADLVAGEWRRQDKVIDPATMAATRLANTAIDGVSADPQAVIEDILRYCATDLVCYRAESPAGLVERQAFHFDPVIDWLRDTHGAHFVLATGVTHVPQPREAIAIFGSRLKAFRDPFALACLHVFTTLTGSALLALAIAEEQISAERAWAAAHVDEDWNVEKWGGDGEAEARRQARWLEMKAAADMLASLQA